MALARRILLIDDSAVLRQMLLEQFAEHAEFSLHAASSGTEGRKLAHTQLWDLILLDVRLPDEDGLSICKQLRQGGRDLPIIMLTGLGGEEDMQAGFAAGATDYIVKPFRFALLLARLQAHLHSYARKDNSCYQVGKFRFTPSQKTIARGKTVAPLTDKEADILLYFCRHMNQVITRATLLAQVWGYHSEVSTHTLETHIYRLRQKLEDDPKAPQKLVTEKGGYRLSA